MMLNPWMLLGIAGLTVPVILHLIHKQKLKPKMLATLRFLDPGDAANAFELVPRDWLQLLLRLLLLLLFVLLMTRFTWPEERPGNRAVTVILDQSMSMQRQLPAAVSLFDAAREQIEDLIRGMNADDRFSLMVAGDSVSVDTGFTRDSDVLLAALDSARVTDGSGRAVVPAIARAVRQLRSRKEVNTAVLLFSDGQRRNWDATFDDPALGDLLQQGRAKLLLMEHGEVDSPNIAVESAQFTPPQVYLGTGAKLTATIRNYSDADQQVEATFREGDSAGETRLLSLAAGESARLDLLHMFESPTDSACSVEISDDVLPADNRFHIPMRLRDRRQILMVAPAYPEEPRDTRASHKGADLLAYAANPGEALGTSSGTFISVKRITPNFLQRVSLPIYSTIILYGIDDLQEQTVDDLVAYARNGGSVWVIASAAMSPVRFNQTFAPLLGGSRLGGLKTVQDTVGLEKAEATLSDTLLLPLVREEWGKVEEITLTTYFDSELGLSGKVALRADNGDALMFRVNLGRGNVCFQTFSCEVDENSISRSVVFVPMVQQMITASENGGSPIEPDIMRVGEIARVQLPELRGLGGEVALKGPADYGAALESNESAAVARVTDIDHAGNYLITHAGKKSIRPRWLAVNHAPGESDMAPLSDADFLQLFNTPNVVRLPYRDLAGQFVNRHEIFPLMILLLFAAFAMEAVFGAIQALRQGRANE